MNFEWGTILENKRYKYTHKYFKHRDFLLRGNNINNPHTHENGYLKSINLVDFLALK